LDRQARKVFAEAQNYQEEIRGSSTSATGEDEDVVLVRSIERDTGNGEADSKQ